MQQEGIGDVTSNERGTAARYNAGKCRVDLLPLHMVTNSIALGGKSDLQFLTWSVLGDIADFQKSGDVVALDNALIKLNGHWRDCADVFAYGAQKYASWNWVKGMKWSVPIGCVGRHSFAILFDDQENDAESGLPHIGHIMCNVVMLRTYVESFPEGNDLPPHNFKV